MTTECVGNAFSQFHNEKAEVIRRSFWKVGLSLPINRSLDYKLDIKGFTSLAIGNWREDFVSLDDWADVIDDDDNDIELISTSSD